MTTTIIMGVKIITSTRMFTVTAIIATVTDDGDASLVPKHEVCSSRN